MNKETTLSERWRPHPWHGLQVGPNPPRIVHAFIEMCPADTVKYEIDKSSGYLRVDRPLVYSSQLPTLYGFIPRTYCGDHVGKLMNDARKGDHDPLDICVFSEQAISKTDILLNAKVIGGLPMLDKGEADDKIIAVLEHDPAWGTIDDIKTLPAALVQRLRHYFLTYKLNPDGKNTVSIGAAYGFEHAKNVITAARKDYDNLGREAKTIEPTDQASQTGP